MFVSEYLATLDEHSIGAIFDPRSPELYARSLDSAHLRGRGMDKKRFFPNDYIEGEATQYQQLWGLFYLALNNAHSNESLLVDIASDSSQQEARTTLEKYQQYHLARGNMKSRQDSKYDWFLDNIAHINWDGTRLKDEALHFEEQEFIRAMRLNSFYPKDAELFRSTLVYINPGRKDQKIPFFIENMRFMTDRMLLLQMERTARGETNNASYYGLGLEERLCRVQADLLRGLPYKNLGLREDLIQIRPNEPMLGGEVVKRNLANLESRIKAIPEIEVIADPDLFISKIWPELVCIQPYNEVNKRATYFTTLSLLFEIIGKNNPVKYATEQFLPEVFTGRNAVSSALSLIIRTPHIIIPTPEQVKQMHEALKSVPHLDRSQYAEAMLTHGYCSRI